MVKGPIPTTFSVSPIFYEEEKVPSVTFFSRLCFGRIGVRPMVLGARAFGSLHVNEIMLPSTSTKGRSPAEPIKSLLPNRVISATRYISSKVHLTSSTVKGCPSDH